MKIAKRCGLYFLFKGNTIVYIGQTKDFDRRLKQHIKEDVKDFDSWRFTTCRDDEERIRLEAYLITLLRPKYNQQVYENYMHNSEETPTLLINDSIRTFEELYWNVDKEWLEHIVGVDIDGTLYNMKLLGILKLNENYVESSDGRMLLKRKWVLENIDFISKCCTYRYCGEEMLDLYREHNEKTSIYHSGISTKELNEKHYVKGELNG